MTTEEPGVVTMRTRVGCPEVKVTVAMDVRNITHIIMSIFTGE